MDDAVRRGPHTHCVSEKVALVPLLLALLLFCACGSTPTRESDGASSASPSPSTGSAAGPASSRGWVVGDNGISGGEGIILATEDGGAHWVKQVRSAWAGLNDVWFTDLDHGWAVGDFRTILATSDGGEHWVRQQAHLPPHAEIAAVCFADARHGWAVGNTIGATFVIRTTNGGNTWRTRPAPGRGYPFDVFFVDARRGWLVGAVSGIYATTDGGLHWRRQSPGSRGEGAVPEQRLLRRRPPGMDHRRRSGRRRLTSSSSRATEGPLGSADTAGPARSCSGCRSSMLAMASPRDTARLQR